MTLGPEQVRELDARYESPPALSAWLELPLPIEAWIAYTAALADARRALPTAPDDVARSLRAAALNTGAIEGLHGASRGLTVTVVEAASGWQVDVERAEGPGALAMVEAALEGYEMALDCATQRLPVTEVWLRQLHEVVCRPQETYEVRTPVGAQRRPLPLGQYKDQPNHVELPDGRLHAYTPVDATAAEMHRLVKVLQSEDFQVAHPVQQAASAHQAFTAIHPFADGNGRVARILASVYFLRAASVPFMVYDDQKVGYFDALAQADDGDRLPFLQFVLDRGLDQLAYARELARGLASEGALGKMEEAVATAERVRLAATRLADAAEESLATALTTLSARTDLQVRRGGSTLGGGIGERVLLKLPQPSFELVSADHEVGVAKVFAVLADVEGRGSHPIGLWDGNDVLDARLTDLDPAVATALHLQLDARMRRAVQEAIAELTAVVRQRVGGA